MNGVVVLMMGAALGAATGASASQGDDWEYQEDAARQISVAAVRYDAGPAIIVQCRAGALSVVVAGVSQGSEPLAVEATRADGRSDVQTWRPAGAPGAFTSTTPARVARFMRGGGSYAFKSANGASSSVRAEFDLPAQTTNLDRVLTACGWALEDDRDRLAQVDARVSLRDPEATSRAPVRGRPRASGARRPAEPTAPAQPPAAEFQISCVVRAMKLTACRADHPAVLQSPIKPENYEGKPVFAPPGVDPEGDVILITGGSVTIIDYLAVVPR